MNLNIPDKTVNEELPENPKVAIHSLIRRWDKYVPEAIDSVINQTYNNWELFIYTGEGSHDKITEYIQGNPKIHLIPGKSFQYTLEIGENDRFTDTFLYVASQGDLFTILDGDDGFQPNFLTDTVDYLMKNNLDVCSCSVIHIDSTGKNIGPRREIPTNYYLSRQEFLGNYNKVHSSFWTLWGRISRSSLFSEELFQNIPDFVESYDTIISQNLLKKTEKFGAVPSVGYKYRVHEESDSYRFNPYREYVPSMIYRVMEESLTLLNVENKIIIQPLLFLQHTITISYNIDSLCGCDKTVEEKFHLAYYVCTQEEVKMTFTPSTWQENGIDIFSKLQRTLNQGGFPYSPEQVEKMYEIARNLCPNYVAKIGKVEFEKLLLAKMSFKVYCKKITI